MKSLGMQQSGENPMDMAVGSETYLLFSVASPNSRFLIPMADWSGMLPKIILR